MQNLLYKNKASQRIYFTVWDSVNATYLTGDSGNITADLRLDGGSADAMGNPTELAGGVYYYAPTQAQTNGDKVTLIPVSSTAGAVVRPLTLDTLIEQTGDSYARIGANGAGLTAIPWNSAWDAEVQSECADALAAYNVVATTDLPSNFGSLGINASGHVSRVTLTDTTTANTDMRGTDSAYTGTPPTAAAIRSEIDSNSTQLAAILAKFSGITSLAGWLRWLARKDAALATDDATSGSEINADGGSGAGAYSNTTDSQEALRDNQGGGGSADWTDGEKEQIRYRLQLDGDQTEPTDTDLPEVNVKQVNGTAVSLSNITFTINNSVDSDGTITLRRGTDSSPAIGTQIEIIKSGYASGAFASGASGTFRYRQADGAVVTAGTASVSQSGGTVTATLTLTDTEQDAMVANKAGTWECDITSSGGLIADHGKGKLIVTDKVA